MMLLRIALASLYNRLGTVTLTIITVALSVAIVLGVEHIRHQAKVSFSHTVSGTDLIVGARSGSINLLLYSVFRIGNATNNLSWESYQNLAKNPIVKWHVPISLGDSHKGYRVIGTTQDYFEHFGYGKKQTLEFAEGHEFRHVYDVVLGATVAKKLNYQLGDKLVLSHGFADVSFTDHSDKPFTIAGILKPTGTPVDQSLHVSLEGIEAIHVDWKNGVPPSSRTAINAETALTFDLTPSSITAVLIGLNHRVMTFRLQRQINNYKAEALTAILPGVALSELWQTMNVAERIMAFIAALVFVVSLLGTTTMMLSTLQQRQQEIAILRTIGAPASHIFTLIQLEVLVIVLSGMLMGLGILWLGLSLTQPLLNEQLGVIIETNVVSENTPLFLGGILGSGLLLGCIPAGLAYRRALTQSI